MPAEFQNWMRNWLKQAIMRNIFNFKQAIKNEIEKLVRKLLHKLTSSINLEAIIYTDDMQFFYPQENTTGLFQRKEE